MGTSSPKQIIRNTLLSLFALVIIFLSSTIYFGFHYLKLKNAMQHVAQTPEEEVVALIREVEALVVLPADEVPSIATVSDPTLLRGHPFFENAQIGYKVLIYHRAGRAILYDPVGKRVIDVAPIGAVPEEDVAVSEEVGVSGDESEDIQNP